ncbi:intradiol ring-cleavage dioxygenase [Devosia ginsengisoli]|uniref:Intradiol ring-cleavage dioxygenase n=1 Tax=Devosia ginsengisoli TaxID=400770 RepID=A0A5B8LNW5_9HYPH|nr:intradiol ring-cleavage dioxygenase [Devosia ginsengisoli]QDZ09786.1 intradiol ring-cleavage dioxygenase [Devosia ginsengisoli]
MSTRDFDEHSITQAVLDRFANTPDPRLKQVLQSLVRHAHDFVRDVDLSMDEWLEAIMFLTRTGQISDDKRQEFILLSDTLGISMLVDAINHRMPEGATETTVLGPFYVQNPPELSNGADISGGEEGVPLHVAAVVTSPDGKPLANAVVDVWQSDDDGFYDVQRPEIEGANLRARFRTDAAGRMAFWTIVPKFYPIPADGPVGDMLAATNRHPFRPAHIHFMIAAAGYETLVTHLFIDNDPYLDSDAVFGVKQSLIVTLDEHDGGSAPENRSMAGPWKSLEHHFGLKPQR